MNLRYSVGVSLLFLALCGSAKAAPPLDDFLRDGRLQDGQAAYAEPADNAERFSLAFLQALKGLQQFVAGANELGINPEMARSGIPFLRAIVPAPGQTNAGVATPEQVSALFIGLKTSLQRANATLALVDAEEFTVRVDVSRARVDWNGDGTVASNEMLLVSLARPMGLRMNDPTGEDLVICFDSADAAWLQGYTHFLTGVLDILTAYDWMPVWNQCAHVVFRNPQPMPPIAPHSIVRERMEMAMALDMIAALHEMRLENVQPDALRHAREEFLAMTGCSRTCWQRILAETDDEHEWLPSPTQTGPGGARVTAEQIEGWQLVLDELDAVLKGDKLLPHWRMKPTEGISIDKLVATPPDLDLVLLIQGSALIPYLEEGPISDRTTWRSLMRPFGPGFARFAIWSN